MDKRIGAQFYTIRDFCKTAEGLEQSFAKVKEIGYQTVQLSAIGPIEPQIIRNLLNQYGLEVMCTHKGYDDYIKNLDGMLEYHKTIGCDIAGLGSMPPQFRSMEGARQFIQEFTPVIKAFRQQGMTFAYHNHAFEFQKEHGRFIMDTLIEESELDFIVDVYWLAFAGMNPADFIRKLGKRAIVIHFKDLGINTESKPCMREVMEGNLDWDSIILACEDAGCRCAMVEQDICPGNPFDSLKISYNNLKTKGFC